MRWLCDFWMHLEFTCEAKWGSLNPNSRAASRNIPVEYPGNISYLQRSFCRVLRAGGCPLGWVLCDLKGCSLLRVALSFLHVKNSESKTLQSLSSDQIVIKSMTQWRLSSCPRSVDRPSCYVTNSYVLIQCNPNVFSLYFIPLCKHVFSIAANVSAIICFNL